MFNRRQFLLAGVVPAVAPHREDSQASQSPTPGSPPARPRSPRRGRHAVFVGHLAPNTEPFDRVTDQPMRFQDAEVVDLCLSLKRATRRVHEFNARQLAAGPPIREWAFVMAICREQNSPA